MKFKVGDKVRVVTHRYDNRHCIQYGATGEITQVGGGTLPIHMRWDASKGSTVVVVLCYCESDLEFIGGPW